MARRLAISFVATTVALLLATGFPASGQSVVSTHSGMVYFFVGSAFLADQPLEQKFGKFPEIGEGVELRTTLGRAEVLLTPGVILRLDENSAIRMISSKFSDTRVELLGGSAMVEVTEATPDTAVRLIYKNWQVCVPQKGVYRVDTEPSRVRAYQGSVDVSTGEKAQPVSVREGEILPLAEVLMPETSLTPGNDDFKSWTTARSQAISADNTLAAGITYDPNQPDNSGDAGLAFGGGGYTYFPSAGSTYPDVTNPYGLSFWSPYQSAYSSVYFPTYLYASPYAGWSGGRVLYPGRTLFPSPIGTLPSRGVPPRILVPHNRPVFAPAPHIAVHAAPHR